MRPIRFPIFYWGSISYFQELCRLKSICFEVFETYPKQTYRNHCTIYTSNGVMDLTIPVIKPNGSKTITNDVLIDYSQSWQKIHWRALSSAYASSPYFEHYASDMEALLFQTEQNLVNFNLKIIQFVANHLELPVEVSISEEFDKTASLTYLKYFEERKTYVDYQYQQVFQKKDNFVPDLSILDALFNLGPMVRKILV